MSAKQGDFIDRVSRNDKAARDNRVALAYHTHDPEELYFARYVAEDLPGQILLPDSYDSAVWGSVFGAPLAAGTDLMTWTSPKAGLYWLRIGVDLFHDGFPPTTGVADANVVAYGDIYGSVEFIRGKYQAWPWFDPAKVQYQQVSIDRNAIYRLAEGQNVAFVYGLMSNAPTAAVDTSAVAMLGEITIQELRG